MNKKLLFYGAAMTAIVLLATAVYFLWYKPAQDLKQINSFETCTKAGFAILLTYPAQCRTSDGRVFTETVTPTPSSLNMANPASVNCTKTVGGTLEIRTAADGGQVGYCHLPGGKICEEWALFRGECAGVK